MRSLKASDGYIWAHVGGCTGYTELLPHASDVAKERDQQAIDEGLEAHRALEELVKFETLTEGEYGDRASELLDRWNPSRFTEVHSEIEIPFGDSKLVIDLYGYNDETGLLSIVEYKYGRSLVEVYENPQLKLNTTRLCDHLKIQPKSVEFVVFQPRGHHIDGVYRTDIWDWFNDQQGFKELISKKQNETPTCRVNQHCLKCDAKLVCKAHTNHIMRCVDFVSDPEPMERTPQSLGNELDLLEYISKQLKKRVSGLEAEVEHLTRGGEITGYILKRKVGSMQWVNDDEKVIEHGKIFGVDLSKPVTTITPRQAIDRKLLPKEVVEGITHRPDGGEKLVKDDSYRRLK